MGCTCCSSVKLKKEETEAKAPEIEVKIESLSELKKEGENLKESKLLSPISNQNNYMKNESIINPDIDSIHVILATSEKNLDAACRL